MVPCGVSLYQSFENGAKVKVCNLRVYGVARLYDKMYVYACILEASF